MIEGPPVRSHCAYRVLACSVALVAGLQLSGSVPDFEAEVAPILEANCLSCHNASDAEGDLNLESRERAMKHPDAIVPGKAAESYLMEMVSGPDPEMPENGDPLSEDEVLKLERWIDAGAKWPEGRQLADKKPRNLDWWSLKPILSQAVPENGAGHPVDAFLNEMLAKNGLSRTGSADPRTLFRRLSYDLTGLPPDPQSIDAFVQAYQAAADQDERNRAWEREVDRILASPEFGEKWAQHWLDIARFAETHGYDKDKLRPNAWPYRDYVIRSLNLDKPYGRFVKEQVAGDVLYPGEPDGIIGLGFLAAGPWDFIGHYEVGEAKRDGQIAKHLDRDEMVSTVFNVFQSTTVQCAQCHTHKFDPIKMEDYYRLHAVFAGVDREDRVFEGLSPEQLEERNVLIKEINTLKKEQLEIGARIDRQITAKLSGIDRRINEIKEIYGTGDSPKYGFQAKPDLKENTEKWIQVDLGKPTNMAQIRIMPAYDKEHKVKEGYGFPIRHRVEGSNDPGFKDGVRLLSDSGGTDQPNPGIDTVLVDVGPPSMRYIRVTATKLPPRLPFKSDYVFALGEIEALDAFGKTNFALGKPVTTSDQIADSENWRPEYLVDGIYFKEPSDGAAFEELKALQSDRSRIAAEIRSPKIEARKKAIEAEIASLSKQLKRFDSNSVVYAANANFVMRSRFAATDGMPRPVHLLNRGDLGTPGERMSPGAPPLWQGSPETFDVDDANEADARAALADYLTRKDNPLVWRTIANRVWQWTFGKPIAGTPNDFGRMGMLPTHPELLDYLAILIRDDPKQSIKSLARLLITSETYRRSSDDNIENAKIDSGNRYYWRMDRRRLTAEEFRDSLLAVSGALRLEERGGKSFYDFVLEKPQHSPHYEYHLHDPEDPKSHRRSIYRFVVRSQPQPMLTTLDCADPSISVAVRDESTSALQALTQWNHSMVEAMSKRFGQRLENEGLVSSAERVERASRLALGRTASSRERQLLGEHLERYGPASMARVLFNLNDFTYLD